MNFKDKVIAGIRERVNLHEKIAEDCADEARRHDAMAEELKLLLGNIKAIPNDPVAASCDELSPKQTEFMERMAKFHDAETKGQAEHQTAPRPAIFGKVDDSIPQNAFKPWTNEGAKTSVGPGAILTKAEVDEIQEVMNVNKVPLSDLIMTAEDLKNHRGQGEADEINFAMRNKPIMTEEEVNKFRGQSKADDHPLDSHPV